MNKRGREIEYPARLRKSDRDLFVSPVAAVDGRLVRPADLLVDADREDELGGLLNENRFSPYDPNRNDPRTDFRQREGAPPYGDINARLRERQADVRLWTRDDDKEALRRTVELVENERVPGVHYNHVFVGEDFYHGGPGGPPAVEPGPPEGSLSEWDGDGVADVAVLDNGLPHGWEQLHSELRLVVDRFGAAALPLDPLDEGPPGGTPDGILDKQAGHGLFICGLINRVAPELNIQLHRVLHASGEGDESLITDTLLSLVDSPVKVINLSLGAFIPGRDGPRLQSAIRRLVEEHKIVVASAGNAGGTPQGPGALFPARMREVIAVGAYETVRGHRRVWSHSCHGDVYAPGVDVLSSHVLWDGPIDWLEAPGDKHFKGWAKWSGTSFAAPLVAAELATLLEKTAPAARQGVVDAWLAGAPTENWPNKTGGKQARRYDPPKDVSRWV